MKSTHEMAQGRWRELLPQLGVDASFLKNTHGPCPICGGKDRFRWDDQNSKGGYICSGCGSGDGFNLVQKVTGKGFTQIATEIDAWLGRTFSGTPGHLPKPVGEEEAQRAAMIRVWSECSKPTPTSPGGIYMAHRTGREGVWAGFMGHRAIGVAGTTHPALVGKIASFEGKAVNLHLTLLTKGGEKADVEPSKRVMRGKLPDGCAIRIGEAAPLMGVAEGVETAVSASIMHGIPVWACVNGVLLSKWMPPSLAKEIVVFGDNDRNFCGQSKAYALANRLEVIHKRRVTVEIPGLPGADWNDIHRETFTR